MIRQDGRRPDELREMKVVKNYLKFPEASVLIEAGETKIICTATVSEGQVPGHLQGTGKGWVNAEYSMLPRATMSRTSRSRTTAGGRTQEIQRIIGRALRAVTDLNLLGERSILIDCDVIQADGSTRTLAINGGFIVLAETLKKIKGEGKVLNLPLKDYLGAVSVGICAGKVLLDLSYEEDVNADADLNIALTGKGEIVEIQGTAEQRSFSFEELNQIFLTARKGINQIIELEKKLCSLEF